MADTLVEAGVVVGCSIDAALEGSSDLFKVEEYHEKPNAISPCSRSFRCTT